MGDLVEFKVSDKILSERIKKEAIKEAIFLYRITGGFVHALPPDEEMRKMFEEGIIEL